MKRRDRFDFILIETTGLADPGPVAQTFYMDDELGARLRLDGIVTLVDAGHVHLHLEDSPEVREQIGFADVILLNKTDLLEDRELDRLEARIRAMNGAARIHRTRDAEIPIDRVLGVGGFNLDRAMEVDPRFMEPEYPFEWGGLFQLPEGRMTLVMGEGPDPSMTLALQPAAAPGEPGGGLEGVERGAVLAFSGEETPAGHEGSVTPSSEPWRLELNHTGETHIHLEVPRAGWYAVHTEHRPEEFSATFRLPSGEAVLPVTVRDFKPDHEHDDEVTSVGISIPGDLDLDRFQGWLRRLLQIQGPDIFRMKGVLSLAGADERFVFQGVHMLFDGRPDRPWGTEERRNSLVFIGRNLDREALTEGFRRCLA